VNLGSGSLVKLRNSLTLLVLLGSWPATAEAYCRTRTCDVDNSCEIDDDGCSIGTKIKWPNGCLTFAVQRDGSPAENIKASDVFGVAEEAFALWSDSECHRGGSPPLTFVEQGEVRCRTPEFNCAPEDWNANVIMFQDDGWYHDAAALAITCVTMNLDSGEILDADIEINTPYFDFALPGEAEGADLRTVLTHEAGHFLGLSHSHLKGSVMYEWYDQTAIFSSLSDDDIGGICEVYPGADDDPKCEAPELPDDTRCVGASECVAVPGDPGGCSCREGPPRSGAGNAAFFGMIACAGVVVLRRRSPSIRNA